MEWKNPNTAKNTGVHWRTGKTAANVKIPVLILVNFLSIFSELFGTFLVVFSPFFREK